jgi:hypothetical protein
MISKMIKKTFNNNKKAFVISSHEYSKSHIKNQNIEMKKECREKNYLIEDSNL